MIITNEQIIATYEYGKRVLAQEITLADAKAAVSTETGMNASSAEGYVHCFTKIMEGAGYTRTINAFGTDYYLTNIYLDYGAEALLTSIASVKKHLEYYEGVGKSSQPKIQAVLEKHIEIIENINSFEQIQESLNVQVQLSLADDQETRLARLKAASKKPRKSEATITIYSRNSDVVAEALLRANGHCEKCKNLAPFVRAKNDTPYLEVHHVVLLSQGGEDTVENTLALCPNCHRELHYGKRQNT